MTNDIIVEMIEDIKEREKRMGDLIRELTTAKRTADAASLAAVFSAYKTYEIGVISSLFNAQVSQHQALTGESLSAVDDLMGALAQETDHD